MKTSQATLLLCTVLLLASCTLLLCVTAAAEAGNAIISTESNTIDPGVRRMMPRFLGSRKRRTQAFRSEEGQVSEPEGGYNYTTRWFQQTLDHFSFRPESYRTFPQRYLINDVHWDRENNGPIFVYAGNEGYIDWFANNTGFLWEIAEEFKALLLFPEHRYYGESLPFGQDSYKNASMAGWLTAEQAMADYAVIIKSLKHNESAWGSPVVMFGGSYGGMLAAWFRMKYPHIAVGAVASSAPILQFEGVVPPDTFNRLVSQDFKMDGSQECFDTIKDSWKEIRATDRRVLAEKFHLCKEPKHSDEMVDWLYEMYGNLAMVDYPVPASFLAELPAHPIAKVCDAIVSHEGPLVDKIAAGANIFANYTGKTECLDIAGDPHGEDGWDYQACTEMVMPMSSNPNNSMFEPYGWDLELYSRECERQWNVTPRPYWIPTQFGGRSLMDSLKHYGSNILFVNGNLDPWTGGAPQNSVSDSIVVIVVEGGAHHYDLRPSDPNDPDSVKNARAQEKEYIRAFVTGQHPADKRTHRAGWLATAFVYFFVFLTVAASIASVIYIYDYYKRQEARRRSGYLLVA
eukprot:jgi/Chlat1/7884/Chrsp66S07307